MKSSFRWFVYLVPVLFFYSLSSCSLFGFQDGPLDSLDVAWRVPSTADSNQPMRAYGNRLYVTETFTDGLVAIDMDNGTVLGRSSGVGWLYTNPVLIDGYVYVAISPESDASDDDPATMAQFNADGNFLKYIEIGEDWSWHPRYFTIWDADHYIYYGTWNTPDNDPYQGLVRLDMDTIEEYEPGRYRVVPEVIYSTSDEIMTNIIFTDDILIFSHHGQDTYYSQENRPPTPVVAINRTTNKEAWIHESNDLFILSNNPFYIVGSTLVVSTFRGFAHLDMETGELLFALTPESPEWTVGNGPYSVVSNDLSRMYSATMITTTNKTTAVVRAISTADGSTIWQDVPNEYSQGSQPQIHEGVVYYALNTDVRAYDELTGELLAVDDSIAGDLWQLSNTVKYNDLMIINSDRTSSRDGEIIAVRMDVHKRW